MAQANFVSNTQIAERIPHSSPMTRRSILTAIAAAAVISPSTNAALGATFRDGELFILLEQMSAAATANREADGLVVAAEQAARAEYPRPPTSILVRNVSDGSERIIAADELPRFFQINGGKMSPVAEERYRKTLGDLEEWSAQCRDIDAAHLVYAKEEAYRLAWQRVRDVDAAIIDYRATTITGILVKFALALGSATPAVIRESDGLTVWGEMAASAMRDLLAVHGGAGAEIHQATMTALLPVTQSTTWADNATPVGME